MSSRLKEVFDRDAKALQQGVDNALRDAASDVQKLFVAATNFANRSLSLIEVHSKREELARLGSSSAQFASCGQRQSWTSAASANKGLTMCDTSRCSARTSSGATDLCKYLGRC